ncbi:CaiB/BaiF CoA transferase family protein [Chloroflexota bacterium]
MSEEKPLDVLGGIRIIDWSIWQQGPFASVLLGMLGAEVIHVEQTITGDAGRGLMSIVGAPAQLPGNRNYYFEAENMNKKSITLDLKQEKGKEVLRRLVQSSDVFIQNFRKGVAEKLGAGYGELSKYNPKLIYATASGFGPKGPDAGEPCLDYIGVARTGMMASVAEPGRPPTNPTGAFSDQMGGIMLAFAVVLALLARERLGIGQEVDASQLGSMSALQGLNIMAVLLLNQEMRKHDRTKARNPLWNHYLCSDDKWFCLACIQADRYWHDFCKVAGIQELEKDPKFENMNIRGENCEELISIIDKIFITKTRDEWMNALKTGGDFIFSPVNTITDLVNDPQMLANDYIVDFEHPYYGPSKVLGFPITLSKTPGKVRSAAPEFGQHTEEILLDVCGYNWEEISQLREEGVI